MAHPAQNANEGQSISLLEENRRDVIVIVPAHNEDLHIGSTVLKLRSLVDHVIVVDDGSTDSTALVAAAGGATVVSHPINRGKGAALQTGIETARRHSPKAVAVIDGDGQHRACDLPILITPVLDGRADVVIGSRYLNGDSEVPKHRVLGHRAFNLLTRTISGVHTSDSQSGFRAFSPAALEALTFQSDSFSVESEMQFIVKESKLRMVEVPIMIRYHEKPKRNVVRHGMIVLNGLLHLVGQYRPLLINSLLGVALMAAGTVFGTLALSAFFRTGAYAIGYGLLSVLLLVMGIVFGTTGLILHSTRAMMVEFIRPWRDRYIKNGNQVPAPQGLVDRFLHEVGRHRPLRYIGIPGAAILLTGLGFGVHVVQAYRQTLDLHVGDAVLCVLAITFGHMLLATALILHSTRALLEAILAPQANPAGD